MSKYILEMDSITKEFPGVKALEQVQLRVKKGEIHALCGENGAGKSTLMKILSGVYPYSSYSGEIYFDGELCKFKDIKQSEKMGIVIIHQELALIPDLSIAENIFLGNERSKKGVINWIETFIQTNELLQKVGLNESPETLIRSIGVGKQQLVEIAKALSKEVKLLILDEPTSALNETESDNLLSLILEFKKQGITSIIISHKLNEIAKIADSLTILRDGKTIETMNMKEDQVTEERIIRGMVGRDLTNRFPDRIANIGDTILEIKDWTVYHPANTDQKIVDSVNLSVKKGEIVGIAGLMGAGRTEMAMSLFGRSYGKKITGQILKDAQPIQIKSVADAIRYGFAYVTEDRKNLGLNLIQSIKENMTLANLKRISKKTVINERKEIKEVERLREKLKIKSSSILQMSGNLSGGNQQKVLLSKWMFAEPDILILDEPTRGIDVGAKYEIYTIIHQLANQGKGIIFISSELPEILGMADRIYVMNKGKITGEVMKEDATQELMMKYMTKEGV
ncbi:multiple monosaccharide ABC transporter ATP-binding protein [Heyndrickxia ginsengihumi]|uniref:ATP-binding cassette domain-containing protein n=1 Tax=Heyndrickxia ginsengihumi TaxID=363870 RepID=A0A6M0P725_9BACI|nr:multiple monosaccharide ABC transporter ATP-binding protein [Heyndrickxia ginsengihumi]MBE6184874.1 ATP-binding cassette domain-containing protein [Bacillus sp. (in: firmicutes)]MCM3022586.1 ATP-binding cassette domain-containing protein [Heyndrickxia ginsengihumi]NEY19078.1 ATP-binding cassette domain-containing protein [Heyndrickxia ginsengihumi]